MSFAIHINTPPRHPNRPSFLRGVVGFLHRKTLLPMFLDSVLKAGVGNLVDSMASIVDRFVTTPDEKTKALMALRELEIKETEILTSSANEALKHDIEDRASARQREIAIKDTTPRILAYGSLLGFFGILTALIFVDIPPTAKDVL